VVITIGARSKARRHEADVNGRLALMKLGFLIRATAEIDNETR
jgi:hypothetical protein